MNAKIGTLYGIGVGPGDPELISLKAVKVLNSVDVLFAASSTKNTHSQAVDIAKPHIPENAAVTMLAFPMVKDFNKAQKKWEENALAIINELNQGKDAAFITLGDSMTYSTYGYILKHVKRLEPDINIISIPGITAYQAAAARTNTPLVEGEEALLILSGVHGGERLRNLAEKPENVVFMKAYKNTKDICLALDEAGLIENSIAINRCGLADEKIIEDVKSLENMPPDYWTLILAKQKTKNGA